MTDNTTKPRPWRSSDLRGLATGDAGAIMVHPLRAGEIFFDAASSNHLPANLPEGDHGSTVLDIGRGVKVRALGNVVQADDGTWKVHRSLHASQYPSGRELTRAQDARAREVIEALIGGWAATHAGDIAQADDFDRNNGAHTLEKQIERHEQALEILRAQLTACEEGEPFTQYPDVPTDPR